MELLQALRARHSVRSFTQEPLGRYLLERVLSDASRAPSAINMQPWEVQMVMGEEVARLSRRLLRSYRERALTCSPASREPLHDRFMGRARQCAEALTPLTEEMGTDFRTYVNEGSLKFYGAPAVALLFLDGVFPGERMTDIGLFAAYLVLAAEGHGLASCPIGLITAYEDEVKDHLNIPESKQLVMSVALGKPDLGASVNRFRSPRAELKEFVRWIE